MSDGVPAGRVLAVVGPFRHGDDFRHGEEGWQIATLHRWERDAVGEEKGESKG